MNNLVSKFSPAFKPSHPGFVIFYVTNRCNFRCNFCFYSEEIEKGLKPDELSVDEIKKIAHLARININENEANKVSEKLEGILGLIDQMTQVNTENIEPMAHALDITQPLREDKVTEVDIREKSLKLSNETDQSLFIVPRVIE